MPKTEKPEQLNKFIEHLKNTGICIYLDRQGEYLYYPSSNSKVNISQFHRMFMRNCPTLKYDDWGNYAKACLPCIIGKTFEPNKPKLSPLDEDPTIFYLNTYKSHKSTTDNAIPDALWFEFLERLFPVESERVMVINWLAHIFQYPEKRPSWHLLITSAQGTGKGFLFKDVLTPLLEHQTSLCADYSSFMNQFSTALNGTLLCLLDDPKTHSDSTQTKLKSKLSEECQLIEEKYEQAGMKNVFTRIILSSNEIRPLMLDDGERRWYAPQKIEHKIDREESQQFITKVSKYLETGGLDVVYNWFMVQDLSDFNHKYCPTTDKLRQMIENSIPMLQLEIEEWLEDHKTFHWEDLKVKFPHENDNLLKKYLTELNYQRRRPTIEGKKITYWCADTVDLTNWTALGQPSDIPF